MNYLLSQLGASASTTPVLRVLLVEDDDGEALLVQESVRDSSPRSALHPAIELTRVTTVTAALRALVDAPHDVVLLDLDLPDTCGLQTLQLLRQSTDRAIVVIAGLADEEAAIVALQNGAQEYLFKNELTPAVTLRALRYARERKAQEDALAKSRWLAGIGEATLAVLHEINNPLTSLIINAELFAITDPGREEVAAILESAQRIADVTRRLARQRMSDAQSVELVKGVRMLDLGDESEIQYAFSQPSLD